MSENPLSLRVNFCRTHIRKNFFSQKVVFQRNYLPFDIKSAPTVNTFVKNFNLFLFLLLGLKEPKKDYRKKQKAKLKKDENAEK